jgi:glutaredoxin-like protein
MGWIRPEDRVSLRTRLADELAEPVRLVLFTAAAGGLEVPGHPCPTCGPTEELLRELAALDPRIRLEVRSLLAEPERARELGVERIPAILLARDGDARVRFYGIPAGFEFATLVDALIMVSRGEPRLSPTARAQLAGLSGSIHLQVFVTPTCPYCPHIARLACAAAVASSHVRTDVVEVSEFPDLVDRYRIIGVPKVVINETVAFEGAVPEEEFVQRLLKMTTNPAAA